MRELFLTAEAAERHPEFTEFGNVHEVTPTVIAALSGTVTPQGVVAVVGSCDQPLEQVLRPGVRLAVVLCAVRDPGNAGTLIRVADAVGADVVLISEESVDPYNGKCVRASAGSLFHVPFATQLPVGECVAACRTAGLQVLAAQADGSVSLDQAGLGGPTAWLFGNEAWGLPEPLSRLADRTVRVPMYGRAESLNLATAGAICLYTSARSQRSERG